ncbi:MAG: 30S ribosomal protein S5, partial [Tagaea sp.]
MARKGGEGGGEDRRRGRGGEGGDGRGRGRDRGGDRAERDEAELIEKLVAINRVAKVVKGG